MIKIQCKYSYGPCVSMDKHKRGPIIEPAQHIRTNQSGVKIESKIYIRSNFSAVRK